MFHSTIEGNDGDGEGAEGNDGDGEGDRDIGSLRKGNADESNERDLFSMTGSTSMRVSSSSLSRTMLNKEIDPKPKNSTHSNRA